jgi:hypothetical protein
MFDFFEILGGFLSFGLDSGLFELIAEIAARVLEAVWGGPGGTRGPRGPSGGA